MEALLPIGEVARALGMTTRTLRYYEDVGLLKSHREAGGGVRSYDAQAIARIKQILVLRAVGLPLGQIRRVLEETDISQSMSILEAHAREITRQMEALMVIRSALSALAAELARTGHMEASLSALGEEDARRLVKGLAFSSFTHTTKEPMAMPKLTDVRIVYLPPAAVCGIHCMGASAEAEVGPLVDAFIRSVNLRTVKPDFRVYGFNHPNGEKPDGSDHGYEAWITIPEDMQVSPPYQKKHFPGGLYAAYMIPMGAFDRWPLVVAWANESPEYDIRWGDAACMAGLLEEHLNYFSHVDKGPVAQLDLLVPIKPREA